MITTRDALSGLEEKLLSLKRSLLRGATSEHNALEKVAKRVKYISQKGGSTKNADMEWHKSRSVRKEKKLILLSDSLLATCAAASMLLQPL